MIFTNRYLRQQVRRDLDREMLFLAGPRQVGKTTFSLARPGARKGYLNWDAPEHREKSCAGNCPQPGSGCSTRSTSTASGVII